jgi:glycosyltransferase involved in cell wall biosynthesis
MESRLVKVDLHVHSHHSDSPKIYLLAKANARECYTSPEDVYQRALARGMDLVTITDHDTIDGALEIAHHGPHVFLSEEVSCRFPDNGCIVHVLVFHITEAQHREIQRLRYNIYDFVQYVRQEGIAHAIAHPLSSVNHRLTREHIEQCFLLFKNIELLNGPRDPYHRKALEQIIHRLDRPTLERWANTYNIEPATWEPTWGFTGGSDDHSGIAIARAYTAYEGPATVDGLLEALDARRTRPEGEFMTAVSAAHNIYSGVVNYFVDRQKTNPSPSGSIYNDIFRAAATGGASLMERGDLQEILRSPLGRVLMAFQAESAGATLPTWERLLTEGAHEEIHQEMSALARKVMRRAIGGAAQELVEATGTMDFDHMARVLPHILQMVLLHIPYYLGFRYFYQDRRRAMALHESIGVGYVPKESLSVAIFVDTLEDVNGVTLGLRRMIRELRAQGKRVSLLGLRSKTTGASADAVEDIKADLDVDAVVRFEALASFDLPGYNHIELGVPPVLEMMQWCVEQEVDLIQVSTPGPTGLAGLTIARMLGTPVVGHYHTQIPEYVERLIGDKNIAAIARAYVGWFYNGLDNVIVPSRATRDNLLDMGIRRERITLLSRGVDLDRFSPGRRDRKVWERYGLNGAPKLLYVGRVSKEKNLDTLVETYRALRASGVACELGIVGDGPYRDELARRVSDLPGVIFTGYVGGDQLADLFASSDIFVFPSTTDTFGNVVLEAQASSLPVIVTDQGGPSELMVPNRTGVVVPAMDATALGDAIKRLLGDRSLREGMGSAAREHVSKMTHDSAARELWDFYRTQVDRSQSGLRDAVADGI